jgi:hypothetical protein
VARMRARLDHVSDVETASVDVHVAGDPGNPVTSLEAQ